MYKITLLTLIVLIAISYTLSAQEFDLLIKGGHVIDPKNGVNGRMDIAVSSGKIARVAASIDTGSAKKTIDARGLYVTPGLINMHTHVFAGSRPGFVDGTSSQLPDAFAPRAGITTVVDAGTSGYKNFGLFKANVIDPSITRVLAFLNIAASGYSVDNAQENVSEMNAQQTADTILKYRDILVGVRIGRFEGSEWTPFDRTIEAATISHTPVFVECHLPKYSLQDQLARMRPGDIMTHAFEHVAERMTVVDEQGKVRPFVLEARDKGILFDIGHGGGGFWFNQAIPAFKQGLLPNSFGTDEHRTSMLSGMKTMLNVMSKYLNMGMSIPDIIARGTWKPAQSIHRPDLGNFDIGSPADIAVLSVQKGRFGFVDSGNEKITGDKKFEAEMTIRAGRIVWDLNGLAATVYK